jgi:hypothetical protein
MERGYAAAALKQVRSGNTQEAADTLKEYLPPVMTVVMKPEQFTDIQQELKGLPELPEKIPITWKDIRAAFQILILVTLSTFPCTIPFLLIKDPMTAMRVSNGVALTLLFLTGFQLGRRAGYSPWLFGILVALLGAVLVLVTIALGG